mgnify:CR=1 FL=1
MVQFSLVAYKFFVCIDFRNSCSRLRSFSEINPLPINKVVYPIDVLNIHFGSYHNIYGFGICNTSNLLWHLCHNTFIMKKQKRWEKLIGLFLIILFVMMIRFGKALHFTQSGSTYLVDEIYSCPELSRFRERKSFFWTNNKEFQHRLP